MVYDKNGKVIKSGWCFIFGTDKASVFEKDGQYMVEYSHGNQVSDPEYFNDEQAAKEYAIDLSQSHQITSSNDEPVSDEWKDIYHTLTEFWRKMGGVMYNCVDDVDAKRFAQDCYDDIETWIQNCKRKGHIEIKDGKFIHNSRQITSSETITSNKEPADMDMAYQLEGYIESDGQLYTQMIVPVIKNLERKVKKGIYDYDKSLILWQHVADEGAKRYVKELGGPAYNVATRKEVAKKLSSYYEENYMGDNPIESSKQIKSTVDFPQDGNEFANLIDKVLDEHHIGNSGAYFIPRKNVFEVDIDGDWKHDHLAADHFLFQELGLSCIDTREIGDSDSDWYEAVHTYQRNSDIEDLHKRMADIFKNIESSKKNINSSWEEDVDFVVDQFMDEWMENHPDSTTEECAAARKKYHDWVYERV